MNIESDTSILPYAIAHTIVEEVEAYLSYTFPEPDRGAAEEYLVKFADRVYEHNSRARKTLRSKSNAGRDWLYVFMRHWLAAYLKDNHRALYDQLPTSFANGELLAIRATSH